MEKMRNRGALSPILMLLISIIVVGCNQGIDESSDTEFMGQADDQFMDQIAFGVSVNEELQIDVYGPHVVLHDASTGERSQLLIIYNFSGEPIIFTDETFSVSAYLLDKERDQWIQINWGMNALKDAAFTLPPHLTEFKPNVENQLLVSATQLSWLENEVVRFYIVGQGQLSGQAFGAFIDLLIEQ